MVGCILMLVLFQLEAEEFITLLPKSITTAIGKGLSEDLGGYASITMATIMLTGIFGNILAPILIKVLRIKNRIAAGVGIGCCSHAGGTSKAMEIGEIQGAMSSIAICVCGIFTSLLALFL